MDRRRARITLTSVVGIAAGLALVLVPVAAASHQFTDVPDNHQFHTEIGIFKDTHITSGCTATTFCPDDFVKRQAMAAFIDRALGLVVRPGESALQGVAGSRIAILDDGTSLVQTNASGLELSHLGFRILRLEGNSTSPNVIGGLGANGVKEGVVGGTIAGGGSANLQNQVFDNFGTVGGGRSNRAGSDDGSGNETHATVAGGTGNVASQFAATVAGGNFNTASGLRSSVGGGDLNTASGAASTVAGGQSNTASGGSSIVAGGASNTASGTLSFAAGSRAKATHNGSFVWGDFGTGNFDVTSNAVDSFTVRARGGARFITAVDVAGDPSAGVQLSAGGGSWASLSDRAAKRDFRPLDRRTLLRKLAELPISSWSYKSQPSAIRHVGPTAQDFRRAFGVGEDARHITSVDADGVALAAIQELARENRALRHENVRVKQRLAALERAVAQLARSR